jgi:hypothetical protein
MAAEGFRLRQCIAVFLLAGQTALVLFAIRRRFKRMKVRLHAEVALGSDPSTFQLPFPW